jgi:hypothetical protein
MIMRTGDATLVAAAISLCAIACGQSSSPSPPTTPTPSNADSSISGTVYQVTAHGVSPLAGVGLDITVEYQAWPPNATSDANGGYRLGGLLDGRPMKVRAEKEGFSQPCAVTFTTAGPVVRDVFLVDNQLLSTSGAPASLPILPPRLVGSTVERLPDGRTRSLPGVPWSPT